MAVYELTSPSGEKYRVTAPDDASENEVMSYFIGQISQKPSATPEQQVTETRPETNLISPLMQGLTFGWADELGGIGARLGNLAYRAFPFAGPAVRTPAEAAQAETERQRAELAATRQESPWTSAGLELTGALTPGIGTAKLAGTGARMLGLGIGEGALAGAGAAEGGLPERTIGAGLGGAAGGLFAGAVPAAGYLGRKTASGVSDIVGRMREEPTTRAGRMLSEMMYAGGMTPTKLQARARQLGPEATVAEAAGPVGTALGQGVIGEPTGQARILAEKEFGKRLPGMTERVRESVKKATGVKGRLLPVLDEINARQKSRSNATYSAAYSVPIEADAELINIMNRPSVKKALPLALRGAADEGRALPQIERIVMQGEDVKIGKENFPDMEALDHVKRSLDDMVSSAYRRSDPEAKAIRKARDALKEKLDILLQEASMQVMQPSRIHLRRVKSFSTRQPARSMNLYVVLEKVNVKHF